MPEAASLRGDVPLSVYRNAPPHPQRQSGGARPKLDNGRPLFSILTICLNAEATLERSINSVAAQTYDNIEYIVCDGQSRDGTIDILRRRDTDITYWCSEPDKGPGDAMSKVLSLATGEYMFILMSDDWIPPDFVSICVETFLRSGKDYVHGDVNGYDPDGTFRRRNRGRHDFERFLDWRISIRSPAYVVTRRSLETVGGYKRTLANDDDWLFRAHRAGFRGIYEPRLVVNFQTGGHSTKNHIKGLWQGLKYALIHGGVPHRVWMTFLASVVISHRRKALEFVLPRRVVVALLRWRNRERA
ncbi:MAG: glycosyltransferase [Alphaproteobacteria bacterium]|nr:glycosyltransferase [Alphaproteobacteria bacterium]